jgi:Fic family protein
VTDRGTIIVLSGAKGAYTSALSEVLAELLAWKHARFSDFIRKEAEARGEDRDDTRVLQEIGQRLVDERVGDFVCGVLASADWNPGQNLVLDGLRHAEVFRELQRQAGDSCDLRVVHVALGDKAERVDRVKRSEGVTDDQFEIFDKDATEIEVEETPAFANLKLNGLEPRGELTRTIIRHFVLGFAAAQPKDEGESVSRLEPTTVATALSPLAQKLIKEAREFAKDVPPGLAQPLADTVRAMNCYYSNRIEGHTATPDEIDRALNGDYEKNPEKRHLQAQAKAHIAVQRWIDAGGLGDVSPMAVSSVATIHDRFFSEFPDPQYVEDDRRSHRVMVVPGSFRRDFIRVGRHEPPTPGAIPRFMRRFEEVYTRIGNAEAAILSLAPAHHRILWIHPFADGNGRVARLMSDAFLGRILDTHSIWSASRGLAQHGEKYKALLAACDAGRRGDLDGRGHLSESSLVDFTQFFLETCIEQVLFMRRQMRLDEIGTHIDRWVEDKSAFGDAGAVDERYRPLHPAAGKILKATLDGGALPLGECRQLLGDDVDSDAVIRQLEHHGVLRKRGGAVAFVLTARGAERFLPGLFP